MSLAQPSDWQIVFRDRVASLAKGMSNRELGELTGHHYENVRRMLHWQGPTVDFVLGISRAFGVSTDWLLGRQDYP